MSHAAAKIKAVPSTGAKGAPPSGVPRAYLAAWAGLGGVACAYLALVAIRAVEPPQLLAQAGRSATVAAAKNAGLPGEAARLRQTLRDFQLDIASLRRELEDHAQDQSTIARLIAVEERMSLETGQSAATSASAAVAAAGPVAAAAPVGSDRVHDTSQARVAGAPQTAPQTAPTTQRRARTAPAIRQWPIAVARSLPPRISRPSSGVVSNESQVDFSRSPTTRPAAVAVTPRSTPRDTNAVTISITQ